MEDKKNFLKKILLIFIVIFLIVIIIFYKNESEEYDMFEDNVSELVDLENTTNIMEETFSETENFQQEMIKIYITGEVNSPGVKELEDGARIEDAIKAAGGITLNANVNNINFAYKLEDGQKVYIPNINEKIEEYVTTENGEGIIENSKNISLSRININKASINELCEIPGVGESLAIRIIDYREQNGKFKNIDELKNVSGIGEKKFEGLKEYVIVK